LNHRVYDTAYRQVDRRYNSLFNCIRDLDEAIVAADVRTEADREVQLKVAAARVADDDCESRELIHRVLSGA
jgi:hypothetical protein